MRRARVRHHTSDANYMIQLAKEFVLEAYCYCCQGYRSIHRALQKGYWSAFLAYYDPNKRIAVERLVRHLDDCTPQSYRDHMPPSAAELVRITPAPGLFRSFFGKWLARRKQTWAFAHPEIRYLSSALGQLREILERSTEPPYDQLISLRNSLCNCTGILEARCYGLAELERARYIEHFDQTERVAHLQLHEIVSNSPAVGGHLPGVPPKRTGGVVRR